MELPDPETTTFVPPHDLSAGLFETWARETISHLTLETKALNREMWDLERRIEKLEQTPWWRKW